MLVGDDLNGSEVRADPDVAAAGGGGGVLAWISRIWEYAHPQEDG